SIYDQLASAGNTAVAGAAMQGIIAVLNQYPCVIGIDVINEANLGQSQATFLGWAKGLTNQIRAATQLPITYSLSVQAAGNMDDSFAQTVTPYCDFADYHIYYPPATPVADITNPYFATPTMNPRQPYSVGESGLSAASGQSAQTARWNAAGTIAADSRCG